MPLHGASFRKHPVLLRIIVLCLVIAMWSFSQLVIGLPTSIMDAIPGLVFVVALFGSLLWLDYRLESRHQRSEQYPRYRYSQGNYTLGGIFFLSSGLMMLGALLLGFPQILWTALLIFGPISGLLLAIGGYWLSIATKMYREPARATS